jgi:hypothetical protein
MERTDIKPTDLPPEVYYKAKKKIHKYLKKNNLPPEEITKEVEKTKPEGETAILRTIKYMKEDLRRWVEDKESRARRVASIRKKVRRMKEIKRKIPIHPEISRQMMKRLVRMGKI